MNKRLRHKLEQLIREIAVELLEDPSGYTAAGTKPDPLDPNDAQRQRTQARSGDYPYDMPISYGASVGTSDDGGAYQNGGWNKPPEPEHQTADDWKPKDLSQTTVWEKLDRSLNTVEIGPQGSNAAELGYGSHGRMGENDMIDGMGDDGMCAHDLDMDSLRQDFMNSFQNSLPHAKKMGPKKLFALLVDLDPEYSSELFAPDDETEMFDTYNDWGSKVYAPGAEEDPTNED